MNQNARGVAFVFLIFACIAKTEAQDFEPAQKQRWLDLAKTSEPALVTVERRPLSIVTIAPDPTAFQGHAVTTRQSPDSFFQRSMKKQSGIILDFGAHLTGFLHFRIEDLRGVADAALRLKFTFAEVPAEVVTPFDPYKGGLSRAWLQDEIMTVSEVPAVVTIPRRVSFRYLKIEVLGSSVYSDFKLSDLVLKATSSARTTPAPLAAGTDPMIRQIDSIGLNTLKECMQTVYEDGPKRDRRLWIGDLYLESLANQFSFKNDSLTRHCLYLLAGLSYNTGVVPSNVFERPTPHAQNNPLFDYALIYTVALKDYFTATGDRETVEELWPVLKRQLEIPKKYIMENGMMDYQLAGKEWWLFFDWKNGLDKEASLQGCVIWTYRQAYELAKTLGREKEVAELPSLIKKMTDAARKNLWDPKMSVFVSGKDRQVSYASQAWMVLAGVATAKEGRTAFFQLSNTVGVVKPGAPYLYHYVIEAMIQCGMQQEARKAIVDYWGGMVRKGADTFWEVYDPNDDYVSPYGAYLVNSYCHAWSCTPVYFIRKYPEIFQ